MTTIKYTETERKSYWLGLKRNNESTYIFTDGTNATFANGMGITGVSNGTCIVANRSLHLERWDCSEEMYFICKITMNNVNPQGIIII